MRTFTQLPKSTKKILNFPPAGLCFRRVNTTRRCAARARNSQSILVRESGRVTFASLQGMSKVTTGDRNNRIHQWRPVCDNKWISPMIGFKKWIVVMTSTQSHLSRPKTQCPACCLMLFSCWVQVADRQHWRMLTSRNYGESMVVAKVIKLDSMDCNKSRTWRINSKHKQHKSIWTRLQFVKRHLIKLVRITKADVSFSPRYIVARMTLLRWHFMSFMAASRSTYKSMPLGSCYAWGGPFHRTYWRLSKHPCPAECISE